MRKILFTAVILLSTTVGVNAQQDTVQAVLLDSADVQADKMYNSGIQKFKSKDFKGAIEDFTVATSNNWEREFHEHKIGVF